MNSLDQVVNLKVKITNLLDESIVATIYAFNAKQEVLAVKVWSPHGQKSGSGAPRIDEFKIINTAFIKSLQVMPPFPKKGQRPYTGYNQRLAKVDVAKLEADLNRAISQHRDLPAETRGPKQKAEASPLAAKVFARLSNKLGKENIQWHGNESILAFKEIVISRPYALNKINTKKSHASKHMDEVRSALRETWLEVDSSKRGG